MAIEVILPVLGETVNECAIVEWFKAEGDPVKRGEPLFSVESDKAVLEVEATSDGFLRRILVPPGQKVPVLTIVALMTHTPSEEIEGSAEAPVQATAAWAAAPASGEGPGRSEEQSSEKGRLVASPRARRVAQERGADLAKVTGTGPGGRVVEQDVLAYLAALPKITPVAARAAATLGVDLAEVGGSGARGRIVKADVEAAAQWRSAGATPATSPAAPIIPGASSAVSRPATQESVPVAGLRRIIAERMAASHQAAARVTLVTEADATALVEVREQLKAAVEEEWGFAPGYNDLLGLIVARSLREFPYMNARLAADGQAIERALHVNLGMAVDTERGLLVPVVRHADQMGLHAFGTEFRRLVERARAGKSLPDDLTGGTFTITNLGMYDVDAFTPIINLPEAAVLGAGRIRAVPAVYGGQIVARQMWALSLSFDHRLVDGAPAAKFLQWIKRLVESPYLMLG